VPSGRTSRRREEREILRKAAVLFFARDTDQPK
jgi:hypothetical protein